MTVRLHHRELNQAVAYQSVARWSYRHTFLLVVGASLVFWTAIILAVHAIFA